MIITIDQLTEYNNIMLQRGAPVMQDAIGYNKPDYAVAQSIANGMSTDQAFDLCNILQKYTKKQLAGLSIVDLKESVDYYQTKFKDRKTTITIDIHTTHTAFHFKYNSDIITIIKTANNRFWDSTNKYWMVKNNEVITMLNKLCDIAEVGNAITYFELHHTTTQEEQNEAIKESNDKLKVIAKDNGDYVNLSFSYNTDILNAIKESKHRKYNADNHSWDVKKEDMQDLVNRLALISGVDYSELNQFIIIKTKMTEIIHAESTATTEIILKEMNNTARKPFAHQLEAAKFLLEKKKSILADEMGVGKTLSAIIAAYNVEGKKLIICPSSLKLNWKKEILFVDNTAKIGIINGKTIADLTGSDWYIINYDILSKHMESILQSNFRCVIMDEAHYIKSLNNSGKATAERAKTSMRIAEKAEYVFLLTGTPITNKTKDIFNLLKIINHPLAKNWMNFAIRYCMAYRDNYGWSMDGSSNISELHEKLTPVMMRRLKNDILDLPEKIRQFIPLEINLSVYNREFDKYMAQKNLSNNNAEQLVKLNGLRKILAEQKIKYTIEQIEILREQEKQVVVFTCYTEVVNQILSHFKNVNIGSITGSADAKERQQAVDNFQNGNTKIIVCNIIAGGVGITLTAADTVLFNDFDWTPANHLQAEDRIHRIGQDKKCNIIYMYAENTIIDEKMAGIIENKLENINEIVDGVSGSMFDELIKGL